MGSQEGKVVTWSKEIRELQESLTLSEIQTNVLIGTLLGDGCLIPNASGKNYRLAIRQCDKQKFYVEWKHSIFESFVLSPPRYDKYNNSWTFRTVSHPEFTAYYKLFYPDGKKQITKKIREFLSNPLVVAVWYMDDGSCDSNGYILNTQSFTREENELLQFLLQDIHGLHVRLHRDKDYWRLYLSGKDMQKFREIVEPYILSSFDYKLNSSLTP